MVSTAHPPFAGVVVIVICWLCSAQGCSVRSVLSLRRVSAADFGSYTCVAANDMGRSSATYALTGQLPADCGIISATYSLTGQLPADCGIISATCAITGQLPADCGIISATYALTGQLPADCGIISATYAQTGQLPADCGIISTTYALTGQLPADYRKNFIAYICKPSWISYQQVMVGAPKSLLSWSVISRL